MVTGWVLEADDPRRTFFDAVVNKPFEKLDVVRQAVGRAAVLHDERLAKLKTGGET